jgi:hypothetical protein
MLDKDDFLEGLYDQEGIGDLDRRRALSRKADVLFQAEAKKMQSAVLVSHWRPRKMMSISGTPTDWLAESFDMVIEIHCECSAHLASERFFARSRHPGHLERVASDRVQPIRRNTPHSQVVLVLDHLQSESD